MGVVKQYLTEVQTGGRRENLQSLTDSTGTAVKSYGVTTLTNSSDVDQTYLVGSAPQTGLRKTILGLMESTGVLIIGQASSSITFFGSTNNLITLTTGAGVKSIDLVGLSATSWGVISETTGLTFSASTVSG